MKTITGPSAPNSPKLMAFSPGNSRVIFFILVKNSDKIRRGQAGMVNLNEKKED